MKLAKIKSKVLTTALGPEHITEFGILSMYLQWFNKEGEYIFSEYELNEDGSGRTHLKDALQDYFFNEGVTGEPQKLWDLAKKTIGKELIDMKLEKIVEI